MSIISGLLVQNALKYLLEFGEISNHVGYNALSDYFNQLNFIPNPECFDSNCKSNQIEYQNGKMSLENLVDTNPEPEMIKPENPWGIKLIDDNIQSSEDYPLLNSFNICNDETLEDLMNNLKMMNSS
uniref:Ubiquitin-like modifier-activating enzyme 5 (Trinotate prediction) n=1 Tax=Myxobolus squamalis TaxID=59785 RepID=A0A6B2G380_MYXSQ